MSGTINLIAVIGAVLIIGGLLAQFYFMRKSAAIRKELWRREDARAAGTVPYDTDGYENWNLPIPKTPNARRYAERKERPAANSANAEFNETNRNLSDYLEKSGRG